MESDTLETRAMLTIGIEAETLSLPIFVNGSRIINAKGVVGTKLLAIDIGLHLHWDTWLGM